MKLIVIGIMLTSVLFSAYAQEDNKRERLRERIEAQKGAFITKKLELTTEDSQEFRLAYNEYQAELQSLRTDVFGEFRRGETP